jgi:AcrR family transcriptional regulator
MACEPACPGCERLRAAALELVGEGGLEALSLGNLGERVGAEPAEVAKHYATANECLYETYDELASAMLREVVEAFREGSDWLEGFAISRKRLLERLAANPAEARVCFVETLRGDRELRRRRELNRRWIVEFLAQEHQRCGNGDGMQPMQIELLIGAGLHTISNAFSDGGAELSELDTKLSELGSCFIPVAA